MSHKRRHLSAVILANLTDAEYDRLMAAQVPYTGATGRGQTQGYGCLGPYVATTLRHLWAALGALGWQATVEERWGGAIIVRRYR